MGHRTGPSLRLATETVMANDQVHVLVLGVTLSSDLCADKHVSSVCPTCFYAGFGWLRGPAVEHWSLADVLSLSCARLVADG